MAQLKLPWKFSHGFNYKYAKDAWLTQSCKCLTLDFALDHILMFMRGSFERSSVLHMESVKIPFIFSSPPPVLTLSLSLCCSKKKTESLF